jgi:hypothetical protein
MEGFSPDDLSELMDLMNDSERDFNRWEANGGNDSEVDTDDEEVPKRTVGVPSYNIILSNSSEAAVIGDAGAHRSLAHLLQDKPEWGNRAWIASDEGTKRLVMEEFGRMFKCIWWMSELDRNVGLALDTACRQLELTPDGYTNDYVWAQLQRTNGREMAAVVTAMTKAAKKLWQEYCKRNQQHQALDEASSSSDQAESLHAIGRSSQCQFPVPVF